MLSTKLSKEVLTALILVYEARMTAKGAIPLPIKFLTGKNGVLGLEALSDQITNRESLEAILEKYENLVCNAEVPDLDMIAFEIANEKVSEAHKRYKAAMIEKGTEHVFNNAYYIDIANEINFFFDEFHADILCDEDATADILDCSLRDGFFEQIMAYASDRGDWNISSLETTGDEIAKYCERLVDERNTAS